MMETKENLPSKLLRGAAILSAAALITKLLGMLQKIPLQNIGETAYLAFIIRYILFIHY